MLNFGKLRNTDTNIDADTSTNTKSTTANIKAGAASAAFVNSEINSITDDNKKGSKKQ